MKRNYHTEKNEGKANERKLAEFLVRHGRMLLPMVQLIEQGFISVRHLDLENRLVQDFLFEEATREEVIRIGTQRLVLRQIVLLPRGGGCP